MGTFADDADFDFDDDDEFDEEEREYRRSVRNRRLSFVLYSAIWILVSVGATAAIYFSAGNTIQNWLAGAFDIKSRRSADSDELPVFSMFTGKRGPQLSKFELGRARFGMTPKMIDKKVSGIDWKTTGTRYKVAMYAMNGARYVIWFKPGKNAKRLSASTTKRPSRVNRKGGYSATSETGSARPSKTPAARA